MHFQFLIEDQSGNALIEILMQKISATNTNITFDCKSFNGLGKLPKKATVKESKTGKLLNDLPNYLRGFNKRLQGIPAVIIVVLDNDDRNTEHFYKELYTLAEKNNIALDHVFCIAVEEMEAWLLGDEKAILAAYPLARLGPLHSYKQDSICGTWEVLADVVYPGGISRLKKECTSYFERGRCKNEWAENIGKHMNLAENRSPSFNRFIKEIHRRLPTATQHA